MKYAPANRVRMRDLVLTNRFRDDIGSLYESAVMDITWVYPWGSKSHFFWFTYLAVAKIRTVPSSEQSRAEQIAPWHFNGEMPHAHMRFVKNLKSTSSVKKETVEANILDVNSRNKYSGGFSCCRAWFIHAIDYCWSFHCLLNTPRLWMNHQKAHLKGMFWLVQFYLPISPWICC